MLLLHGERPMSSSEKLQAESLSSNLIAVYLFLRNKTMRIFACNGITAYVSLFGAKLIPHNLL